MPPDAELLLQGYSYKEVANILNMKVGTVTARNNRYHRIDIFAAFKRKVGRDGLPNVLDVSDAFGYWFAGFVDGEGSFIMSHRKKSNYDFGLQISLRSDDVRTLEKVKDSIGGCLYTRKDRRVAHWVGSSIGYCVSILVPLFDRYPLYTKKSEEFQMWKPLVIRQYINTMGGRCRGQGTDESFPDDWAIARTKLASTRKWVA